MQFSTWSFPKLAVVLGTVGMLAALGSSYLLKPEYVSKATLRITPVAAQPPSLNEMIRQLVTGILSRASLSKIINDPRLNLYSEERKTKPFEDVIEEMKGNIQVLFVALPGKAGARASAFDVEFTYPDGTKARQTVQALVNAFMVQNLSSRQPEVLDVLDAASQPVQPRFPDRGSITMMGLILGLICAALISMIQRARNRTSISLLASNA